MEQVVTGCVDCPFVEYNRYDTGNNYCIHPSLRRSGKILKKDKEYKPITPKFCPLKQEPITIKLKQD